MLTLKENFYETWRSSKPDAFVNSWEVFPQVWDPVFFFMSPVAPGGTAVTPHGITLEWRADEPGVMPITTPDKLVCPDAAEWKKYVKLPDMSTVELDWTAAKAQAEAFRAQDKFVMCWMPTGLFETCHFLLGFEGALCAFYEEPEAMHELIAAIKEMKMAQIKLIKENINPDVLMFHDDWGSKTNLFMAPDMWREFFKEPYREIYSLIKGEGMIAMHHADSYCQPIARDMVEIGIDIWEGVLPSNDIQQIKKDTDYKLLLMGGIEASVVDVPDWTEEKVRAEVQRACREYSEGGCFIPCLTYGGEGSIFPGVNDCIMDEIRKQSKIYFG